MDSEYELDEKRRALLAAVLAGGAIYTLPAIATLSAAPASAADAQAASSNGAGGAEGSQSSEPAGGQPEVPGGQGSGPETRPAEPGDGGLGRNSGRNPVHDGDKSSKDGAGSSISEDKSVGLGPFHPSQIGRGFV